MALTREEVLKIAKLSKLSFEEKEIEKFQIELNDILGYIDMLNEVDTSKVEPLVYINDVVNNFREKEEKTSLEITKVLLNAPESAENAIVVPKVVGE
ncbi:Asp-tRNA(Asn)/Glu-tRNA(Gln) amidotransferase subunit GatC [Fusobacterium hwasookii]|uniref:Aspartyl/glutamyl-tRNA(Asn/Gln) amidotransferase subunit C n=3 Tax=Fusobacterium hwasookii TaxID=1583098 RepID=A0A0S2ZMY4_9FUSO|nr:Asp-tRNA(Asn)/Glu-tRNA(Gln) amidotransferase subunit GatC [Fusobacterium hwasookii]ALQ35778.1 glutamyl-tRNA amidotransferase [Fusobacterium hwasookii ChDC F206]ALQ37585.1 glutamyl-tRNA amidotransferase [Fusobacterium hwasookii ChDC F300]ALQ40288.1 glutamyl-tRNA amidotransferase [Fusobacterium hwasookii ChDC F174]EJU08546.1 glutamyl-tRNA(Gln) amidotransferase subunit C [Fusobacterium hwasookii ChDC F128]QNE67464.1 Asp-tRNA(Asn)/Glu-tRNA(Gln) amidotransferase subunit GatC [Fusobacterium hwaso